MSRSRRSAEMPQALPAAPSPALLSPIGAARALWGKAWCAAAAATFTVGPAALLAMAPQSAQAGESLGEPLWEAGAGAAALRLPHYRGSSQSRNWLLPVPYVVYRGDVFRADRDGTRAVLLEDTRFNLDLSFSASAPVDSRDDTARQGMADLSPTVEFGPKLNLAWAEGPGWKLAFRAPFRAVATLRSPRRVLGWSAAPVLNLDCSLPAFSLGLQAGPLWATAGLNRYTYDVAPAFATVDRPAYQTGAGYAGWQATAAASRRWGPLWLGAFLRLDSVAGAVFERSPLVTSPRGLSFGLAATWVFKSSAERVSARH